MNIFNLFITAFKALMKNGLRTLLTMLGIIIGVAAVIVMESIGKGSEEDITARINSLGSNMIIVAPNPRTVNGVKMGQGGLTLEYKDVVMIKRYSSATKYCSPLVALTQQVKYHASNWSTRTVVFCPNISPSAAFGLPKARCLPMKTCVILAKCASSVKQ